MQRPQTSLSTSQRIIRSHRNENGEAILHPGSARPATPGKNVLARPPSSLAAFNYGNRLGTIGTASYGTVGGGERPITQYGVAGMRPETGRGMMRQVQDKRYYLSLLQLKIRELSQEITTILRDIEAQAKERTKFHHYDKLAKDLAKEVTNLQSELADYNTVVDKLTSDVDKSEIERETFELAGRNHLNQIKIEEMLEERLKTQQKAREISNALENRSQKSAVVVSKMTAEERSKFETLTAKKNHLDNGLSELQKKFDDLCSIAENLETEVGNRDLRMEAAKLEMKLIDLEEKKRKLLAEEERKKMSPEEEKEKILARIKVENLQISAAEAQLNETKKRIQDGERFLERLQTESEENETEKRLKFKELKKRETLIEDFMNNFESNKEKEGERLGKLENLVVENLGNISKILSQENLIDLINDEELILNNRSLEIVNSESENEMEKLDKLREIKMEMEILQAKIECEREEIENKIGANVENNLEIDLKGKEIELKSEIDEKKRKLDKIEEELKELKDEFEERKIMVNGSELIREINELQIKEEDLKSEREMAESLIENEKNSANFGKVKKNAMKSVEFYNNCLKENLKSLFVN